jgi:hypothetical protein
MNMCNNDEETVFSYFEDIIEDIVIEINLILIDSKEDVESIKKQYSELSNQVEKLLSDRKKNKFEFQDIQNKLKSFEEKYINFEIFQGFEIQFTKTSGLFCSLEPIISELGNTFDNKILYPKNKREKQLYSLLYTAKIIELLNSDLSKDKFAKVFLSLFATLPSIESKSISEFFNSVLKQKGASTNSFKNKITANQRLLFYKKNLHIFKANSYNGMISKMQAVNSSKYQAAKKLSSSTTTTVKDIKNQSSFTISRSVFIKDLNSYYPQYIPNNPHSKKRRN